MKMRALLLHLQSVDKAHFDSQRPDRRVVEHLTSQFASPNQARSALDRILVERTGGDWPRFSVSSAAPSIAGATAVLARPTCKATAGRS